MILIMNIKPIQNNTDLKVASRRLHKLIKKKGADEAAETEILAILIEVYEKENYPISRLDPIDAIKFRMDQQGLKQKDLEFCIGAKSRVSEVLNRKRSLSLRMIKRLHKKLKIPYESLIGE